MEQLVSASLWPHGSFGALLRACRHRANMSQEQLAARAELSERTVRDLEAGRVRSPRIDTVRLLADALQLTGPQRTSWFEAARGVNRQRAEPTVAGPGGAGPAADGVPARLPQLACGFSLGNTPRCRRSVSTELRAEIVELRRREDRPAGQVAQDVDLIETAARVTASQAEPDAGIRNDGGLTSAERQELAKLRRENRRFREGVELLKRATAILATATR
jgi:transposase